MKFWLGFAVACIAHSMVWTQVRFVAISDARQVLQGSSFQIRFELQNAEGSQFSPPDFSAFKVMSGPSRSIQTSIINGRQSSSMAYVYELLCPKAGTYTVGPAKISAGGRVLQTMPVTIEVVKAQAGREATSDVFIRAELDKSKVYAGEQCILTYTLYTRISIENIEAAARPDLDAFNVEWVNMLENPVQREIFKGKEYMTKVLSKTVLFPIKTGNLNIDPTVYRIVKGERDPFGFGMPSFFQGQVETISSNGVGVTVLPLPDPIPQGFSGAVGDMQMRITSPGNRYSLDDAIQCSIEVRGNANFLLVKPKLNVPDSLFEISDFKAADPIKVADEPEIIKTCVYQFLLLPKVAGQFELSPEFVFFDPKNGKYVSLRDRLNIEVKGEKHKTGNAGEEKEAHAFIEPMRLHHNSGRLIENPWFYVFAISPFLTLGFIVYQRRLRVKGTSKNADATLLSIVESPDQVLEVLRKSVIDSLCQAFPELAQSDSALNFRKRLSDLAEKDDFAKACYALLQKMELRKYSGQLDQHSVDEFNHQAKELGIKA